MCFFSKQHQVTVQHLVHSWSVLSENFRRDYTLPIRDFDSFSSLHIVFLKKALITTQQYEPSPHIPQFQIHWIFKNAQQCLYSHMASDLYSHLVDCPEVEWEPRAEADKESQPPKLSFINQLNTQCHGEKPSSSYYVFHLSPKIYSQKSCHSTGSTLAFSTARIWHCFPS